MLRGQREIKSSARENDAIKTQKKHMMYEIVNGFTQHTDLQKTFLISKIHML